MTGKPYVICHMISSLDGGLHPSHWTKSPDGSRSDWTGLYESLHETFEADAWMVGRVTMAEMSKAEPHAPAAPFNVERPHRFADRRAGSYAIAPDISGKLHFSGGDVGGDHVIVLLGRDVPDSHLAELASDGVSYLVSAGEDLDLAAMLATLSKELDIRRILLEGGAGINGSLLAAGLVDELSLLVAPVLDGRLGNQTFVEHGDMGLGDKIELSLKSCEVMDHGVVHLRYDIKTR